MLTQGTGPGHDGGVRLRVPVLLLVVLLSLGLCRRLQRRRPKPGDGTRGAARRRPTSQSYFEAVASYDPDAAGEAPSEIAADGSPAQGYAAYLAGSPPPRSPPGSR